ncbi:hypothetical protein VAB18032_16980 [Micromonospora maris AB-18-032]|nr:hypothetical protein VAB18032_16980 [Micromonospora maris AB-18-032]
MLDTDGMPSADRTAHRIHDGRSTAAATRAPGQ